MNEQKIIKTPLYRKKGNCILKYRNNNIQTLAKMEKSQVFPKQYLKPFNLLQTTKHRSSSLKDMLPKKASYQACLKQSILNQLKNIVNQNSHKKNCTAFNSRNKSPLTTSNKFLEARSKTSMTSKACLIKTRKLRSQMMVMRKKSQNEVFENNTSLIFSQPKIIRQKKSSVKSIAKSELMQDVSLKKIKKEEQNKNYILRNNKTEMYDKFWAEAKMQPWELQQDNDLCY